MASKILRLRVPAVGTLLIMRSATMCLVRFPWCLRSWRCAATVFLNVSMQFGHVMWTRTQARGGTSPLSFFRASLIGVLGICSNVPPITIPMGFALSMRNAMPSAIRDFISEHPGLNPLIIEKLLFADSDLGLFCERQYAPLSVCRKPGLVLSVSSGHSCRLELFRAGVCGSQLATSDSISCVPLRTGVPQAPAHWNTFCCEAN